NISLITDDICNVPIENADTILLTYSLQFVPTKKRLPLLQRIFNALPPHGTLLLSEKILSPNHPELFSSLHTDYKLAQDYSALEIRQKRDALENVLIPKTLSENINLLSSAGFTQIETIFQYVNFVTILGRKEN
ncbi:MAG: carboxy-S-adenosyl-L-methionine synthase CmoA, partial [Candidatus Margulisiibacteriota bacterium]